MLFLERDMGASLLLFGVFIVMLWVATGRWAYLVLGLILFAIGAYIGYLAFSHVQVRVDAWLHAMDPGKVNDEGYQLSQGWFALASGGMVGTGLGLGSPTLIPYVGSDFILAAFGEELGMLGVAAVLLLYLVIVGRGLRIAVERARQLREAARGRRHDGARAAGVRDRRGSAASDPVDRRAVTARQLWRHQPCRVGGRDRAAAAHVRGAVLPSATGAREDRTDDDAVDV